MNATHTITLNDGYKSRDLKDASVHRAVTFGRRPTGADMIRLEKDQQASIEVQRSLLLARSAITAFGEMKRIPPPLSVLMSLNTSDREAIIEGYVDFLNQSRDDRTTEELSTHELRLAFGLTIEGEVYDVIIFAGDDRQFSGYDDLKLEREYGTGLKRDLAAIGRETLALGQSESELRIEGEVGAGALERLDAYDVAKLLEFYADRRSDFREKRRGI